MTVPVKVFGQSGDFFNITRTGAPVFNGRLGRTRVISVLWNVWSGKEQ